MIHKHSITKNILDATPVILGAAASTDMVTFAYGTLKKALERTSGHSGEIEFGYDEATKGGQILVGGTPVTSKILDVDAADKSNASTGVQIVTVTYVDSTQSNGKNTKTFEVISDTAVKAHIAAADAALIGTAADASSLNTINAAKNYAKAAGWTIAYDKVTDSNNPVIQLKSQDGTVISSIQANDFIKDGMLQNAELVTSKPSQATDDTTGPWLVLTWNTDGGSKVTAITLKSLVDTYSSGNANQLTISDYTITPVTADPSTSETTSQALATAGQVKAYVDAKVSDKNVDAEGDGTLITATAADNKVTVAPTAKLTAAVGLAEGAVQSVVEGTTGSSEEYVSLSISESDASVVTITISDAELVTKFGVVDTSINNNNASIIRLNTSVNNIEDKLTEGVTGQGDTYVSLTQDGTNKLKLNAAATEALTTAVANANSAVQSGAVGTNANSFLTNVASSSTLTVEFVNAPINSSANLGSLEANAGTTTFVTARAIKDFVDSKTSAALSWIMLDTQS